MTRVFGGDFEIFDDTRQAGADPVAYSQHVRQALEILRPGDKGIFRIRRPRPTAAFSPQDTVHERYGEAKALVIARGFMPVERGTGGRLTVFDEGALGITIVAPDNDPREHMLARYELFSQALVKGLRSLGLDARTGELPNEYCPGKYSIHASGRIKLVGVAQRMKRQAFQLGAVISVQRSENACTAIAEAYSEMGLAFDPGTYGGITDLLPGVTFDEVSSQLITSVGEMLR